MALGVRQCVFGRGRVPSFGGQARMCDSPAGRALSYIYILTAAVDLDAANLVLNIPNGLKHATNFQKRCVCCVFWTTLEILRFVAMPLTIETYAYEICNNVKNPPVQHLSFIFFHIFKKRPTFLSNHHQFLPLPAQCAAYE